MHFVCLRFLCLYARELSCPLCVVHSCVGLRARPGPSCFRGALPKFGLGAQTEASSLLVLSALWDKHACLLCALTNVGRHCVSSAVCVRQLREERGERRALGQEQLQGRQPVGGHLKGMFFFIRRGSSMWVKGHVGA